MKKKVKVSKLTSARAMMQLSYNAGGVTLEKHKLYTGGNRSGNTVGRLLLKKLSAPHDIILN